MDSGSKGINISMRNERLELALAWCKKNNLESIRLNIFDREYKKKLSKEERRKLLSEKIRNKV